jgi:hypothetical protein
MNLQFRNTFNRIKSETGVLLRKIMYSNGENVDNMIDNIIKKKFRRNLANQSNHQKKEDELDISEDSDFQGINQCILEMR